jgi:hypothetical protein
LEVWLDGGEPIEQVPDSLKMAGYPIEGLKECTEGEAEPFFKLQIRRPDLETPSPQ